MRRPHPYLAISLACAAVVLVTISALACPAAAQRGGGTEPVFQSISGWPIYPGSTQCAPFGSITYVPNEARVQQIRDAVLLFMATDLDTGVLTTPLLYVEWRAALRAISEYRPRFARRATWVMAAVPPGYTPNCESAPGRPQWCGCAAGIGYLSPMIDASNPARVESLVAWETANGFLGILNRPDAWDGTYVSGVVNRAAALCGGWRDR